MSQFSLATLFWGNNRKYFTHIPGLITCNPYVVSWTFWLTNIWKGEIFVFSNPVDNYLSIWVNERWSQKPIIRWTSRGDATANIWNISLPHCVFFHSNAKRKKLYLFSLDYNTCRPTNLGSSKITLPST